MSLIDGYLDAGSGALKLVGAKNVISVAGDEIAIRASIGRYAGLAGSREHDTALSRDARAHAESNLSSAIWSLRCRSITDSFLLDVSDAKIRDLEGTAGKTRETVS
jgi:hypothetical protein